MEVALQIADQYWRLRGSHRPRFIAFKNAYHGDTAGAASLEAAAMFREGEARQIAAVVIEPMVQGGG
jgi:adenosylmethionine-8-amino-7-oxononanoate aminotransferase